MVAAKKEDLLHCWTSSSDISGYHADIHEGHGTVGAGQGRGVAWERHGHGVLCVNRPLLHRVSSQQNSVHSPFQILHSEQ